MPVWVSRGQTLCFLLTEASKSQCLSAIFLGNRFMWGPPPLPFYFYFLAALCSLWDLSSPARDQTLAHGSEGVAS